ncbi:MAG: bacterial proteasome activator family protein [Acidimicrobiales bacterium]|nr:bacterial proteasome activator family protein [Acidimicrobiales bacterium]
MTDAEIPEVVPTDHDQPQDDVEEQLESISEPAKVMRIGAMIKQLLEEVRQAPLDEAGRERLAQVYDTSIRELSAALSPDLREELDRLTDPFEQGDIPTEAELRIAQAQLVGWLEGLFHGIQAALFAQQMAARQQLDQMRQPALPQGVRGPQQPGARPEGPGVYL